MIPPVTLADYPSAQRGLCVRVMPHDPAFRPGSVRKRATSGIETSLSGLFGVGTGLDDVDSDLAELDVPGLAGLSEPVKSA